ncbi:polysaccharide deacetylase family sporulation protein PdaB [Halobacillus litoralis]|uniref:polysaccharide deacetylase family sporulation protein PdaB n=1 Tax=Halobacillus litoralis TaxID=45668 RepID=UPI001CD3A720|nr:polysaccharide deacetylase family sporulation protein PdaB [Halobacillus litoralis]MCA0972617.1 polysaccharide deacetylase family sporulation protein PdaB [Halobacillus litoralis]
MVFFSLKAERWKRYGVVVVLALFCALFLWVGRFNQEPVFSNNGELRALSQGSEDLSYVALTFNISWGTDKVQEILKQLEAYDAEATFFLSGAWAERHPDIVKDIHEGNHEIAMMGYEYESYLEMKPEQVSEDLKLAQEAFAKLGFEDVKWIRPPHGHFDKEVLKRIDQAGMQAVQWSINPRDWENPGTNQIVDQVMDEGSKGDIILLHASDSVKQTPKALEVILPGLKQKGLEFVSITELVSGSETETTQVN